ncbi:MAG TPA: hypothetical protein VFT16_01175 [Candidatus Saccharimonadales bacterium]|nr:hypothetical protein [Candidatus Saccharimonadales bacterium]
MIKHPIAKTLNGTDVYVDLIRSPASATISQQPYIVILIKEMLRHVSPKGQHSVIEFDFGRIIGSCDIVSTGAKDHIMYAKPINRDTFYRFVRRRQPEQTACITIVVRKDDEGDFELLDTWFGKDMPGMPGASNENDESKEFWQHHAIVLEGHPVQSKTLTLTCPF